MAPRYSFARAELETSQAQVVGLWAQGLGDLVDRVAEEKYRNFYLNNPAGRGDCVLLVENASGQAVGVQGFVPRGFWKGARQLPAAAMADFVVVPEHRSLGPALKLMRTGIELGKDRFSFLYGTPNEKSLAIVRRAGLATLGELTRYTKLVRSESYWVPRLPAWLVPVVAALADAAIVATDLGRLTLRGDPYSWGERSAFNEELDAIWAQRTEGRIYSDRSRKTLAWRYSDFEEGEPWRISIASSPAGTPTGYVIWRLRGGVALISDFLLPDVNASIETFLRSFAWYARRFAAERVSLEFFGADEVVKALLGCGFAARERSTIVYVDHTGSDAAMTSANAYMTTFDRDNEE